MSASSPERWQEISPYLDHALSLSAEERESWLADLRSQRLDLAELLGKLLTEHRALAQEHFLEHELLRPTSESWLQGKTVGAYKLISRIGEGGMSSVWLAERSDGRFERRVAIKFLHFSVIGRGGEERFKREGKILGQLAHPHIAELLDAGVNFNREPYIVLEYVEGEQIDLYCDHCKLDVDARIKLFRDVLLAVSHAHANLIVHRDIKPSNVLVRSDGQVKLLDFGIAKLLADKVNPTEPTQLTLEGAGALTPRFAAPEQVTGGAVTTATDVYALGILLYVLLTGRHPAGPNPNSPADLVRAITETDPPPASAVVSLPDSAALAEKRATSPEKLRRMLRGDLDTIVAKALKKNPRDRYTSVTAFGDDLRHYLQHEPTSARPDAFSYRLRKYVRRHLVGVMVGAGIALLLVTFAVTLAVQLHRITRERDRADRITQFMTNMFKVSDPSEARGNSITAREILDKASKEIDTGLAKDPEAQAQMMYVMGNVYSSLGLYSRSEALLNGAVEMRRRVLGLDNPDTLDTVHYLSWQIMKQGRYAEAEKLQRDALEAERRVLGDNNEKTCDSIDYLASILAYEGRYPEAEKLYREELKIERRIHGHESRGYLLSLGNLGWLLMAEGRYAESENLLREAVDLSRRILGEDDPHTLRTIANLSGTLTREDHYPEAERLQREEIDIARRVLGAEHPDTLASISGLAEILIEETRYAEAEKLLGDVLTTERRVLGSENPRTAATVYELGCLAARQGQTDAAFSLVRQAVDHGLLPAIDIRIDKDRDLTSLHGDPRFAGLVVRGKEKAAAQSRN